MFSALFFSLPALFLLPLAVHPSDAPYVSFHPVSISAFIKRNGFFLGFVERWWLLGWFGTMLSHPTGKHVLSATWILTHKHTQTRASTVLDFFLGLGRGNLEMDIFFWLQQADGSVCTWKARFAKTTQTHFHGLCWIQSVRRWLLGSVNWRVRVCVPSEFRVSLSFVRVPVHVHL